MVCGPLFRDLCQEDHTFSELLQRGRLACKVSLFTYLTDDHSPARVFAEGMSNDRSNAPFIISRVTFDGVVIGRGQQRAVLFIVLQVSHGRLYAMTSHMDGFSGRRASGLYNSMWMSRRKATLQFNSYSPRNAASAPSLRNHVPCVSSGPKRYRPQQLASHPSCRSAAARRLQDDRAETKASIAPGLWTRPVPSTTSRARLSMRIKTDY